MKKRFLILLICAVLVLTGCGSSKKESNDGKFGNGGTEDNGGIETTSKTEKVMKCSITANNGTYSLVSTYEVYHDGEYVSTIKTTENLKAASKSDLDYMEEYLDSLYSQMKNNYGGYTYTIDNDGSKVVTHITADYTTMNLNKLLQTDSTASIYIENGKVTLSGLKTLYQQSGISCEN